MHSYSIWAGPSCVDIRWHVDFTFVKLDRVSVSPDWEDFYPLALVSALYRILSDHAHLYVDFRVQPRSDHIFISESA